MKYKKGNGETVVVTLSEEDKKFKQLEQDNASLVSQLDDMYLLMADMISGV